jgi:hypothetical protein
MGMSVSTTLEVNGKRVTVEVDDPNMLLLYALRNDLFSNAMFDAIGVRLRSAPFTPQRGLAAFGAHATTRRRESCAGIAVSRTL